MKIQQIMSKVAVGVVIALVHAITFDGMAQATRQESTNQLKKVVYTFDPSACPQMIMQKTDLYKLCGGMYYYSYRYYALLSVPEITENNMPSIEFWWNNSGAGAPPSFWSPMPTVSVSSQFDYGPLLCFVTNGLCGVLWKVEFQPPGFPNPGWWTNNYCPELEVTNVLSRSNKIVIVYETTSTSNLFKLNAAISPSGISLTVPTVSSRTYAVEYTPVLPPTDSWHTLVSNIVGNGSPVLVTDSNNAAQRFYRGLEQ